MRAVELLRLAAAGGRVDRLRIGLTAFGALLATAILLAASTVVAIAGQARYYSDYLAQPGLRPGVTTAFLLVGVPVLFFVGQCVRVGAPARDRRLAAVRMAGATPGQAVTVAAAETGLAAALGTVLAFVVFQIARVVLREPGPIRHLPTDVLVPWWVLAGIAVTVPLAGALLAALALRRTALTPFGAIRRRRPRPPRVVPALLFIVGAVLLSFGGVIISKVDPRYSTWALLIIAGSVLITLSGLIAGCAALSALLGRWIADKARGPALLLAGRRLISDPWAASRTLPAVFAAVLIGAGVFGIRALWVAEFAAENAAAARAGDPYVRPEGLDHFQATGFNLASLAVWVAIVVAAAGLLVATIEQIIERRRTLAALAAQGTPRGVLARALLLQTALPLVPGVLLAGFAGFFAARGVSPLNADEARYLTVPWLSLSALFVGSVLVTLLICAIGLAFLGRAVDVGELRAD